jgi:hypothetical protein
MFYYLFLNLKGILGINVKIKLDEIKSELSEKHETIIVIFRIIL